MATTGQKAERGVSGRPGIGRPCRQCAQITQICAHHGRPLQAQPAAPIGGFAFALRSQNVTGLSVAGNSARRFSLPGEVSGWPALPGGTGEVGDDEVGRVPVQAAATPFVPRRCPRAGMGSGFVRVAQRDLDIERGGAMVSQPSECHWPSLG